MPNIVFKAWVKYVNNQRILVSIICGKLSTTVQLFNTQVNKKWLQNQFSTTNYHYFYPTISTYMNTKINLLNIIFTHNPQGLLLKLIKEI
jgi:hypothetical protein